MSLLGNRLGLKFHPRFADTVQTIIRTINVLVSHVRAHRHQGLVVMDRHLYCQLALRSARGLPRGFLLPWILRLLPNPDLVVHFMIGPEQAHRRVLARGTDSETLQELSALDAAYRSLPEFAGFTEISAGSAPGHVLVQLQQVMETRWLGAGLH
jgi:dTMP kinase